jgi:hypothetical protein
MQFSVASTMAIRSIQSTALVAKRIAPVNNFLLQSLRHQGQPNFGTIIVGKYSYRYYTRH